MKAIRKDIAPQEGSPVLRADQPADRAVESLGGRDRQGVSCIPAPANRDGPRAVRSGPVVRAPNRDDIAPIRTYGGRAHATRHLAAVVCQQRDTAGTVRL